MEDERQRLYARALKERENWPIRGKWAEFLQVKRRKERDKKKGNKHW